MPFGGEVPGSYPGGATNVFNMGKYLWNKEKLIKAVAESISYNSVLRKLNIPTSGNNAATLKRKIKEYNLDISHFTFKREQKTCHKHTSIEEYLNNSIAIKTAKLKERLLKEGFKVNKCERCGITEWQGAPIIIQLHHVNGDSKDNRLENLQMLCPNCHSQTDNYCGNSNKQSKQKYYCPDCGREISKHARKCLSCASKSKIKVTLTKEQLKDLLDQGYTKTKIGEIFGVTEAAIRKWIKKYSL